MIRTSIKKAGIIALIMTLFLQSVSPFAVLFLAKDFIERNVAYAAINPLEKEYMVNIGPIVGSTTANYVFASFYNPAGSGRTASIKRLVVRSDTASSTLSNYVNLTVRRITSASAGTQIASANFPKKNASSSDSIIEIRNKGVTVALAGTVDSRIMGQPLSGAVGAYFSTRDITFNASDENIVIQPGEGIAVYQEAAGAAPTSAHVFVEWDETTNAPAAGNEFLFAFPRVSIAATANYVYNSFFNPAASGKTAVVKRIWFGTETCGGAAVYTNSISLKRISAASAGTVITATNIPKKNTSSSDSVMDFRHTNVTVTQVGTAEARLGHVTPCGAAGQATGWQRIDFNENDEKLILQQGEGIALISEATGNANQFVRMIVEWDEVTVANTPSSQGEYVFASNKVASSTALNTTLYSFFNPAGSGKNISIKRLTILADATATAAYTSFQFRRLTAASGGTAITATDLVKKHTGSANSIAEMRWCLAACSSAIATTYDGTTDSRIISVTGASAVGQTIGDYEIVFGANEKLVLKPGEGIGLYNDVLANGAGSAVKINIEWNEDAATPTAQGEYLMNIGPINGNAATTYNYMSFFNPIGSGKTALIKRVHVRVDTIGAAAYIPMQVRRITTRTGGTAIASSSYPKKNTTTGTSVMEVRTTGVTVSYAGATTSKLITIQTPGAVASAIAGNGGYEEVNFTGTESIVVQPGEGIVLYQDPTAGNTNFRVRMLLEWSEVASAPTALGDYLMTIGPVNQSLTSGYIYATIFNPITSAKNYIVRKFGMQVDRSGAATNPTYIPATVRRISAASAGTLIATTSVQKNTSSSAVTAEIRSTGVTATLSGTADSRLMSVTVPGVVDQTFGDEEENVVTGDELVLKPGEGLAMYQEQATGDANTRYHMFLEWNEASNGAPAQSITFSVSTTTLYFGQVSSVLARYASSTNTAGSDTEVDAHTVSVITNATNGYTVSVQGATLSYGSSTINAIGATATTSLVGTEQFGLRVTASGGSGTTTSPFNTSNFAYTATATTSSLVASASVGDNATTTYAIKYVANVASLTEPGTYNANLVYIATANF